MSGLLTKSVIPLSKFCPPHSPHWLQRPRLYHLLDQTHANGPIVWIAAPAGYGKTVLTAGYLAQRHLPVLWYRVDNRDADPGAFFFFLREAARQLGIHATNAFPPLTAEFTGGETVYARNFCEALFNGAPPGFVLVLDDFQQLPGNSATATLLPHLLECVPEAHGVFILSRHQPPPALARLRANQQLGVVGESTLRLTVEETQALINAWPQEEKQRVDAHALHQLTQGWAAGTILTLRSEGTDITQASDGESHIFDYLAAELLADMEPQTRQLLLTTALPPQFDLTLASSLCAMDKVQQVLDELLRRNLFVYHEADGNYRYHPLFRRLLLHLGEREWSAEKLNELRVQAAEALLKRDEIDFALPLLESAGAWQQVVEILMSRAQEMMTQGRYQELDKWLRHLPGAVQQSTPWITFWRATALLPTRLNESYALYNQAYQDFWQAGNTQGTLLSWIGAVDAIIYSLTDTARLDRWLQHFAQIKERFPLDHNDELFSQLASRMTSILILRKPDDAELANWRHAAELGIRRIEDVNQRIFSGFYLCTHSIWQGNLSEAAALIEKLLPESGTPLPPLAATTYSLAHAWLSWTSGDHDACVSALNEGLELAQSSGVFVWYAILLMQGSTNAFIHGRPEEGEPYLSRLLPQVYNARDMDRAYYHIDSAWLHLSRNDLIQAADHQQRALRAAEDFGAVYTRAEAYYGMALVQNELGDAASARHHLDQARVLGRQFGSWTMAWQCALAEAQFSLEQGDEIRALDILRDTLSQARAKGVVAFNGWRPNVIARLCALALAHDIHPELVHNIIRRFHLTPPDDADQQWPWPVRIHSLGHFALQVSGEDINLSGGKHRRPCDLLKLLLAAEPHGIAETHLAEILWPELDGDIALRNLRTNLHRLRRLLQNDQSVVVQQGQARLNTALCWSDAVALERLITSALGNGISNWLPLADKLRALFDGPFLPGEELAVIVGYRDRLQQKLAKAVTAVEDGLRASGQHDEAQRLVDQFAALTPSY